MATILHHIPNQPIQNRFEKKAPKKIRTFNDRKETHMNAYMRNISLSASLGTQVRIYTHRENFPEYICYSESALDIPRNPSPV